MNNSDLDRDIERLIKICKSDFERAYLLYKKQPVLGRVVKESDLLETFREIQKFVQKYPQYLKSIQDWQIQLEPFAKQHIITDFNGCIQAIESLPKLLNN